MDWMNIAGRAKNLVGKYKYVLLILLLGILLMSLPEGSKESMQPEISVPAPVYASKAEELEAILSQISGVGKVRVMLTEAAGSETIYQTDEEAANAPYDELARGYNYKDGTIVAGRKFAGDYNWADRNGDNRIAKNQDLFCLGVFEDGLVVLLVVVI